MKLSIYPTRGEAVPVPAAQDGGEIDGIPRDTCEYATGLLLYFRNNSDHPHTISIGKTVRQGEAAKPYDFYQFVIPPGKRDDVYRSKIDPTEAYYGPFDAFVPTEDLTELGLEEGDVQIRYLSGTDDLFVAAIGKVRTGR